MFYIVLYHLWYALCPYLPTWREFSCLAKVYRTLCKHDSEDCIASIMLWCNAWKIHGQKANSRKGLLHVLLKLEGFIYYLMIDVVGCHTLHNYSCCKTM